jgi:hypothetical protein
VRREDQWEYTCPMKKLGIATLILFAAAMILLAAGIDGKWTIETQGRNGPQQNTLIVKSAGAALTGTFEAPGRGGAAGMPVDITDGKVDGNKFSFTVPGGRGATKFEGTADGDQIKGTRTPEGRDGTPFTGKRAN